MPHIVLYTTSHCPFCIRAKALLRSKGAEFDEVDVEFASDRKREMVEKSGRTTVPQIWIGNRHIGGCDDLMALEHGGELDALLST